MEHPLHQFIYCPVCGNKSFEERNEKAKQCTCCNFVYYFNPSAAVACFLKNTKGELLLVHRGKEPAKGTLDLPGGFIDMHESAEEAIVREITEETGVHINSSKYLFSLPNIYPYCNFDVHTVDIFFECQTDSFEEAQPADDAAAIIILAPGELNPDDFGLASIRKAVTIYTSQSF